MREEDIELDGDCEHCQTTIAPNVEHAYVEEFNNGHWPIERECLIVEWWCPACRQPSSCALPLDALGEDSRFERTRILEHQAGVGENARVLDEEQVAMEITTRGEATFGEIANAYTRFVTP